MDYAATIKWKNKGDFEELFENTENELLIEFEVIKTEIWKVPDQNRWNKIYHCKILTITPQK